jgi:hypothetical protein
LVPHAFILIIGEILKWGDVEMEDLKYGKMDGYPTIPYNSNF